MNLKIANLALEIVDIKFEIKFVHVGDKIMAQVTATFSVVVNQPTPPPNPLTLTPPGGSLPDETVGSPVTDQVTTVSGGKPPYTFAISNGSLPPGVGMTQTNNPDGSVALALNGAPTVNGSFSFDLQVTDSDGATATASVSK